MAVLCCNYSTDCCDLLLITCITSPWRQASSLVGGKKRGKESMTGKEGRKGSLRTVYLWKARWGGRVGGGGGSCYRLWCFIHFTGFCMWRQMWTCLDREQRKCRQRHEGKNDKVTVRDAAGGPTAASDPDQLQITGHYCHKVEFLQHAEIKQSISCCYRPRDIRNTTYKVSGRFPRVTEWFHVNTEIYTYFNHSPS